MQVIEAEAKAKYEDEMQHFTTSLATETCLLLYPWVFKDEEGHRRDKKASPPYVELVEEILPENYNIEQEFRKRIEESMLKEMFKEVKEYILRNAKTRYSKMNQTFHISSLIMNYQKKTKNYFWTENVFLCD